MLKYLTASIVLLLPGIVSLLLDMKFSGSRKNPISKYCFYSILNNIVMLSAMLLCGLSKNGILISFVAIKHLVAFLGVSLISSVFMPTIVNKRLPAVYKNCIGYILRHETAFIVLCALGGAAFILPRFFNDNVIEVFSNIAFLGGGVSALLLAVIGISAYRIFKGIRKDGFKSGVSAVTQRFKTKKTIEFNKHLGIAALVNFAFAFSVILFIPYETYLGNAGEFTFEFSSFWWIVALEALIYFMLLTVFELFFKGKAFDTVVALVFGVTVASYVQSMFLNGTLSQMDGTGDNWSTASLVINLAIWAVIALIPVALAIFDVKFLKTICCFGGVLIFGMQAVALVSMIATVEQPGIEDRISDQGLYEVSSNNNAIVIVLDCFDSKNIDELLEKDPTALDGLRGFTCYDNVTGSYGYTHLAVPYLLSGERIPQYNPTDEQFETAIKESKYYNSIADKVSSFGVYTDEFCVRGNEARNKLDNLISSNQSVLDIDTTVTASQKASFYRIVPFFLKNRFSYTSENFNSAAVSFKEGNNYYLVSAQTDANIVDRLEDGGLTVNQNYSDGCFRFIHTHGAHSRWNLDANGNYSVSDTDKISASLGSLKLVAEYLESLQELGVYENSTIIITSDHGTTETSYQSEAENIVISPIMFYKPAGVGFDEPCERSSAPVSHDDIFPTIAAALGIDYSNATGMNLNDVTEDTQRTRYYYWCFYEDEMPKSVWSFKHVEFAVSGDVHDPLNWKETGNVTHCHGWIGEE